MWGWVLVGDPLDFMRNDLSAKSQTSLYYEEIKATGDGDVLMAFVTNIFAVYHTAGYVIALILCTIPIIYLYQERKRLIQPRTYVWFILLMPFLFDVLTVYTGNVPVEVPEFSTQPPPGNMFNIRYSLFVLPFVIVLLAKVIKNKYVSIFISCIVMTSYLILVSPRIQNIAVLKEAGASGTPESVKASLMWFVENHDGNLVLASTGAMDGFMFDSGIPLRYYVTEGSYELWPKALKSPQSTVNWVLLDYGNKRDAVNNKIDISQLRNNFTIVYKNGTFTIWKRNSIK